ncbi:hypothetical protein E2542_SST11881 [Spatholobus suberectus]|nr:hypothetical protein E2542_SST11881 [Spatholobus suberectus]
MPMTSSSERLVLNQLPQPATRPPNSYDTSFEIPSTAYPQQHSVDESWVVPVPPSVVKEDEGERKFAFVEKLVNRVLDKCEKLPASFRDQIDLEEMLAKERKKRVESQSTTFRGLQQPVEEKLDRFKVRTVVAEEVVKEDNQK